MIYTHRNKVCDTGAIAMLVSDFQDTSCEFITLAVTDSAHHTGVTITAAMWSEMLAAAQDTLAVTHPTIPAHDDDHHTDAA